MDAISGGDCSYSSFEAIEDAAAYAFGDGNNGNGDAIDASANATAAATVVVEELDESLTRDFSDEIWFIVLQLLFGADIDNCMRPDEEFGEENVHCLIPNFGLVSKSCLGCCHRFVRQVPLGLYQSTNDYHRSTMWLCRNNVKLETIDTLPENTLELCQWLYMLRSPVNTSELKTMKVSPSTVSLRDLAGFGAKVIKALKGGIPPEVIVMAGKHLVDVYGDDQEMLKALESGIPAEIIIAVAGKRTESGVEDSIVNTFREVNPPLETLTLDIKNRSFYEPLLEMASQTLTH